MSATPPLSVVVTTYRRAHELGATLDSLLAQQFGDFEPIVSDDCSPDATEELCREYERRDSRVRYRRNAKNLNMPGNLNAGLREARAPLIANLHDGDVYRPDLLARWKEALDQQPDAAFVFSGCDILDAEGRTVFRNSHSFKPRLETRELVNYYLGRLERSVPNATQVESLLGGPAGEVSLTARIGEYLSGPFDSPVWGTVMGRRAAYAEAGYFNPRYGFFSDLDMWLKLNLKYPVAYIRDPLFSLGPRGADRPHGFVSWKLDHILIAIFEACIDGAFVDDPAEIARYRAILRRLRDRRWILLALTCLRHGRLDLYEEGLRVFGSSDSLELRTAAVLGRVARLVVPRRAAGGASA